MTSDPPPPLTPKCQHLSSPNIPNFIISIFLVLGILVSYLPQHYKIISRRSSQGLSPMFVLLGTVSGTASIGNILTLPESTADMACCRELGWFPCVAALLGVVQIGVQWGCFFFIMLLFLLFFPRTNDPSPSSQQTPTSKQATLVLALSLTFTLLTLLLSLTFTYALPTHIRLFSNLLGLLATSLAAIQYLPQIHMTWRLQETGSLSVPMMCIQTPGSFVFAASLAARFGLQGWSAWGLFVFTGTLQGLLLAMCLRFSWRDRKSATPGVRECAAAAAATTTTTIRHEETPLLREDHVERIG